MSDEEIALGEFSEVYLRAVNDYLGMGQPCAKEPALFSELHASQPAGKGQQPSFAWR